MNALKRSKDRMLATKSVEVGEDEQKDAAVAPQMNSESLGINERSIGRVTESDESRHRIPRANPDLLASEAERIADDLRDLTAPEYIDGKPSGSAHDTLLMEAADLLESQARQIATLTAENKGLQRACDEHFALSKRWVDIGEALTAERDQLVKLQHATHEDFETACDQVQEARHKAEAIAAERDRAVEALRILLEDYEIWLKDGCIVALPFTGSRNAIDNARAVLAASLQPTGK